MTLGLALRMLDAHAERMAKEARLIATTPVGEAAETESDSRDIAPAAESTLAEVIASFTDALVAKVSKVVEGDAATRATPPDPDQSPRPAAAAPVVDCVAFFSKDLVSAPGAPEVADVTLLAAAATENADAADAADADFEGAETTAAEPPVRVNSRRVDGRVLCPNPTCGRTFGTDSALYGHMRIHGGATQSKRSRSLTEPPQRQLLTMDGDDSDTSSPAPKVRRISRIPALNIDGVFDLDDDDTVISENGRPVRRTRLASAADENNDEFADSPMSGRPASAPGNFAKGLEHGPIPRGLLFPYDIRVGDDFQADMKRVNPREKRAKVADPGVVWDPRHEHAGLDSYLEFAGCKGIRGPGLERMKTRGQESAHHIFHKTYLDTKVRCSLSLYPLSAPPLPSPAQLYI